MLSHSLQGIQAKLLGIFTFNADTNIDLQHNICFSTLVWFFLAKVKDKIVLMITAF